MTITRYLCAFVAILLTCGQLFAHGGTVRMEDRYYSQHIDSLPPEVRNSILRKCGMPKATDAFARYFDNLRRIVLHFEHFVCDGDGTYCTPSGCLHQEWISVGGHYRLVRGYYAPD
jgi:hypothetical protein